MSYDCIIKSGLIYDGGGNPPYAADLAIRDDRIALIGGLEAAKGRRVIDAGGLAVAPGFINMLSWAAAPLMLDGRSLSDIRQGVTLEVFGEGHSMGPLNAEMRRAMAGEGTGFDVDWTTLGGFLERLEGKGISPNVASFVGATTLRIHALGYANRRPTARQLADMQGLVRTAMAQGALGVGAALIYAPAAYADTAELTALAQAAAEFGGLYASHLRSESDRLLEAVDELIEIAEISGARAEIHHLKMAGAGNWDKFDALVARVEQARARGLGVTANMYTYTAGATGLDAAMPPWVQEGGFEAWAQRLRNPEIRARLAVEMAAPADDWENLLLAAGAEGVLLTGFRNERLRAYLGKTLAEVAKLRGTTPEEAAMDLVVEDGSQVKAVYFLMSEENVAKGVALPWVSFCSDARSIAAEGRNLKASAHPRTYGSFARLLAKYVRDERVLSLEAAIHKLTKLPASNLRLRGRGELKPGHFADLVIFDPNRIQDHATFAEPHRYATGVHHVFVNGQQVLAEGEHTGAFPGRFVRGPGWTGWR